MGEVEATVGAEGLGVWVVDGVLVEVHEIVCGEAYDAAEEVAEVSVVSDGPRDGNDVVVDVTINASIYTG